jgi:hypothetical protein
VTHGLPLILTLDLPEATPSNNTIKGQHYRVYAKTRATWKGLVAGALQMGTNGPPLMVERCFISIERHSAGGGLDWDNAYGGLKPLLDCLVAPSPRNPDGLGLIRDDNPRAMPLAPALLQLPAKRGQGRTVVRIYDASTLQTDTNP